MDTIISAAVTGLLALIGVIISNKSASNKMQTQLEKAQAVTDTKIDELTREVREHNNFAKRMPVVEEKIQTLTSTVDELKGYHKPVN